MRHDHARDSSAGLPHNMIVETDSGTVLRSRAHEQVRRLATIMDDARQIVAAAGDNLKPRLRARRGKFEDFAIKGIRVFAGGAPEDESAILKGG